MKNAELNLERSDIKAPAVVNCAIDAIKRIKFPPSSRGMDTTVNYPFDFKPDGGGSSAEALTDARAIRHAMADAALRRSTQPPAHDAYTDLLSETRALEREGRAQRDAWFHGLALEGKDELLFEFEVLLKATACFSNPRNHPGPPRRTPVVAQDLRSATLACKDGMQHAVILARQLLGPRDRAFVFHRYLETVLPEDNVRTRLLREGASQATPEDSLIMLRHALTELDRGRRRRAARAARAVPHCFTPCSPARSARSDTTRSSIR